MIETNRKIIKNKVGLLNLAEQLGNVSRACKVMGFSRDIFYSGSSLKIGQSVGITFHTPQDFCCQEQNESSSYYKNLQYNQSTLFLSQSN